MAGHHQWEADRGLGRQFHFSGIASAAGQKRDSFRVPSSRLSRAGCVELDDDRPRDLLDSMAKPLNVNSAEPTRMSLWQHLPKMVLSFLVLLGSLRLPLSLVAAICRPRL